MNGYLLINKPVGWTSFRVVSFLKKKFVIKKIGHAGTLDPFAEGLLIILVGKATKDFDYFKTLEKEYEAVIYQGKNTDTYDVEGKIIKEYKNKIEIKRDKLKKILKLFIGETFQKPPIFSALKIKGRPAYKMARGGEVPKINPRKIFIKKIELQKIANPRIYLNIVCSSGTYIRSIAYDLGQKTGYGAFLEKLKRTRIGNYSLANAKSPDDIILKDLIRIF